MSDDRKVDANFVEAMEERLSHGRENGMVGWDQLWEGCTFDFDPMGFDGLFMRRLFDHCIKLIIQLQASCRSSKRIREKCADVANFSMFVADIHGALDRERHIITDEINWQECFDDDDNTMWEGNSPYHDGDKPFQWRIKQRLEGDKILWFASHDSELGEEGESWQTLDEAKVACQLSHNHIFKHETSER